MTQQTTPLKMASSGFTLVELLVTMAIVAVLATIAVTSYTSQVQRSRRTDARSAVLDLAGREEKLFTTTNAYSATPSDLGYAGAAFPIAVGSGYYTVNVAIGNPPVTYLITATTAGTQVADKQCVTLSVDQTGAQTSTGTGTAATCWGN